MHESRQLEIDVFGTKRLVSAAFEDVVVDGIHVEHCHRLTRRDQDPFVMIGQRNIERVEIIEVKRSRRRESSIVGFVVGTVAR